MWGIWRVFRRFIRRGRWNVAALAGPLAMVMVVCMWISMAVLGWTLVYWPHFLEGFVLAPGLDPDRRMDMLDALCLSLVNVATLGFGDIVPESGWMRVAAPVQAMAGFGLLTATVSWVLQIYPALNRRRRLAIELAVLRRSHASNRLVRLESSFAPTCSMTWPRKWCKRAWTSSSTQRDTTSTTAMIMPHCDGPGSRRARRAGARRRKPSAGCPQGASAEVVRMGPCRPGFPAHRAIPQQHHHRTRLCGSLTHVARQRA
ncbi:potassium channel family protein [Nonomuraea sp. 10N515B]|uniref:potassium channel family protein n=1 Tax=Nonomuraea sp. 10N515B TaxID=3457422 RepID=UPI003FCE099A